MTQLSDFPPDVQALAKQAHAEFADSRVKDGLGVIFARVIMADRAARQQRIDLAGLTIGQAAVLEFIAAYQRDNAGRSPTFDQIAAGAGFSSKSNVSRILDILTDRGRIRRDPRSRAITIIANPASQQEQA